MQFYTLSKVTRLHINMFFFISAHNLTNSYKNVLTALTWIFVTVATIVINIKGLPS